MTVMQTPETLARASTPHGEVALRRRGEVIELIVNGVFAMDSVETASEIALADAAPAGRVLVGGLGLGYTAARLLDRGASSLDVVELAAPLIEWARAGITPQLGRVAADPRVRLHAADIADWITTHAGPWEAVLLDVDNGPSFLIHDHNARVYTRTLLDTFLDAVAPGGVLLVWCEERSPALWATLRELDADASEIGVPIEREGRHFDYALYRAVRAWG
jgi:spermidine synthase